MKFIFLGLISVLSLNAFAQDFSCLELYQKKIDKVVEKREKYNEKYNTRNGDGTKNDVISLFVGFPTAVLIAANPIAIAYPVTLLAFSAPYLVSEYKNRTSGEEKALRLLDETNKDFLKFVKKVQNRVSPDITSLEIEEIISEGFESGKFCADYPKLYSQKKIRKLVINELELRYQHRQ